MKRLLALTFTLTLPLFACSGAKEPADTGDGAGDQGGGGTARKGLEGFCDHYKACGGGFYKDAEACVQATINYWKECRRPELNAFGDCMLAKVPCAGWNPDAYNPASTPCASEWAEVRGKSCN